MAGMLVGSFVFGLMADRFGRLLTLVASATVLAGAGTLSAILPASMPLFTTLRYSMGLDRRHGEIDGKLRQGELFNSHRHNYFSHQSFMTINIKTLKNLSVEF